jgi:crossover junction endodeoxyribonuclease RuvC
VGKKSTKNENEKIILGLDPGTILMGYGVIKITSKVEIIQYGVIRLKSYDSHELRLKKIYERVAHIIEEFLPDEVALEAPFYGKNVQSMLKLGRAQGVSMAAALAKQIPIFEYAPKKVKMSVTGSGTASKEQVAQMIERLLSIKHSDSIYDATDALAVAICHHFQRKLPSASKKGWKSFLKDNPDRIA